jgi:hypothetical protein
MSGISIVSEFTPVLAADYGFEQITMTGTAGTLASFLTAGIPDDVKHMMIYPETNDVRWRADGTNPTSTVGLVMTGDEQWVFENQRSIFNTMIIIATNGTKINVHFYR